MLEALIKHPSKHSHMQVLKQCPSPHLTSPLSTHLPASSSLHVFVTPMWFCLLLSFSNVTAHARQRQQQKPPTKTRPGGHHTVPIHNRPQADALTQIIHTIRTTRGHGTADWHPKAIENVLRDNHKHPAPYGDIVVALTKYARDSDKRTPSFLFDALADWHEPGTVAPKNPCEDHGFPAHNCHSCKADILVGDRPPEFMGKHYDVPITGLD